MGCAVSPTDDGRIASPYGYRSGRRTGKRTFHAGLDLIAPRGTPLFNAAPGFVETIVRDDSSLDTVVPRVEGRGRAFNGYGNVVVVRHDAIGTWSAFMHLDSISVTSGQEIGADDLIGEAGNTSNRKFPGMGSHLHFEVRHANPYAFKEGVFDALLDPLSVTPFPGPYGAWNIDPAEWLGLLGVKTDGRQLVEVGEPAPGCPVADAAGSLGAVREPPDVSPQRSDVDWMALGGDAPPGLPYEPPGEHFRPERNGAAIAIGLGLVGAGSLLRR